MSINPLRLAIEHQDNMRKSVEKIRADASCITRLMVGKVVRRKADGLRFTVTEVRLGLSGSAALHGKADGRSKHRRHIGTVYDVELFGENDGR